MQPLMYSEKDAETKGLGDNSWQRAKFIYRTQGLRGLWRGFIPGGQSALYRNGAAMIVMQKAQAIITDMGGRD